MTAGPVERGGGLAKKLARAGLLGALVGAGLLGLLADDAIISSEDASAALRRPRWSEIAWPFLIDQWGTGRAFRCRLGDCGPGLSLYLRAKVGFCNCSTGVADDDDLDRVGDVELLGRDFKPVADGRGITAGALAGRARRYLVERIRHERLPVFAIALANRCDAIAATIVTEGEIDPGQERAALDFLGGETVQQWAAANTGLQ